MFAYEVLQVFHLTWNQVVSASLVYEITMPDTTGLKMPCALVNLLKLYLKILRALRRGFSESAIRA